MARVSSVTEVRYRVCVELDSGQRYYLKRSDLSGYPLEVNAEVDEDAFHRYVLARQYPEGLEKAVAMLAVRACSREEIRRKLTGRGICEEAADLVVYKLEKEGLLNDREFTEQWVRYRSGSKYGGKRIYRELRMKGIDEETAAEAVEGLDEEETLENAVSLARKVIGRRKPGEDLWKLKQKAMQSLVRRGYDWDTARKACDKVTEK